MKRIFAGIVFLASTSAASLPAAAQATVAQAAAHKPVQVSVAPADEYFGKMKMSILGIRNEIHDLTLKIGFEPAKAESFLGIATMTEDALTDWQKKYPDDPWIPKTLFSLERMYSVVHWSNEMNARATRIMTFIHVHYGTSWYGKQATQEIAGGQVGKLVPTPAPLPVADPPAVTK